MLIRGNSYEHPQGKFLWKVGENFQKLSYEYSSYLFLLFYNEYALLVHLNVSNVQHLTTYQKFMPFVNDMLLPVDKYLCHMMFYGTFVQVYMHLVVWWLYKSR